MNRLMVYPGFAACLVMVFILVTGAAAADTNPVSPSFIDNLDLTLSMGYFQRSFNDLPGKSDVDFFRVFLTGNYQIDDRFSGYLGLGITSVNNDGFFRSVFHGNDVVSGDYNDSGRFAIRLGASAVLMEDAELEYQVSGFAEMYRTQTSDSTERIPASGWSHVNADMDFLDLRTGIRAEYYGLTAYRVRLDGELAFSYMTVDATVTAGESGSGDTTIYTQDDRSEDMVVLILGAHYDIVPGLDVSLDTGLLGDRGVRFGVTYAF